MAYESRPALFQPIQIGHITLQHRIVFAPCTRRRATKYEHVPILPLMKSYYEQRASTHGTLLISEGTIIAKKAGGYTNVPGIWSEEQIKGWKEIVDAVHAQGSFIFLQLWALGRAAIPDVLQVEGVDHAISSGSIPISKPGSSIPVSLTLEGIREFVELYAQAAKNAVFGAGFDGVEIHSANGYLVDQFLQDTCNNRTDEYGGSVENRSRFGLEVVEAVTKAVGEERTGIRISPWSMFQDMRMKDPIPQFTHYATQLKERFPKLAFLHVIEPRIDGSESREVGLANESNDFIREIWSPRTFISAGGYTRDSAIRTAEEKGDVIGFGRYFISNPDLPVRIQNDIPWTKYDRKTFNTPGESDLTAVGYLDYPFAEAKNVLVHQASL
ncbi:NADH:flavin oxidoreductase/NADH oxidase [Pluteus cervinus]|uniref:NADH:flavin oxidoreductase/NADH oxidase n=1 Tax=Pluteus cervinus TaxID=181527 RepID=A0ACD3AAJ0_9AGAR|nr:NADH:flavin oxidoreductase/NADH oxidase [Pluteus cervinus]